MGPKCTSAQVIQEPGICGSTWLEMNLEDGRVEKIFFYPDEIWLGAEEALGKTVEEMLALKRRRDLEYLRS